MSTLLLIKGGKPVPRVLKNFFGAATYELRAFSLSEDDLTTAVVESDGLVLFSPAWNKGAYLRASELWHRYLLNTKPTAKLLLAGYQALEHPNYLDMLRLGTVSTAWLDTVPSVQEMPDLPPIIGIDLQDKLHRFFAGHGQDSVVAVLSRIRLVVQMASGELERMETPYNEIYRELVEPAQLAEKWSEWRNRWINYAPLFEFSPIAAKLQAIATATAPLEDWMMAGGIQAEPLRNGSILEVLNYVRQELQQIEKQYVVQKLSHTYR